MRNTNRLLGGFDRNELPNQLISDQNITSEPVKTNQIGLSVSAYSFVTKVESDTISATPADNIIILATDIVQIGDIISFTSGTLLGLEIKVKAVNGLIVTLVNDLPSDPSIGDTVDILRYKYPVVNSSGVMTVIALQGTTPWSITGSVNASQAGTWNINNISGTISLPTGAATSANQSTEITALGTINTTLGSPFQAGGSIANTSFGVTGNVTVIQPTGSNLHVDVDNFPATQPITGTVTADIAPLSTFQTSQYTIGLTAIQITPTPLANRSSISIKVICSSQSIIYVGNSSGVTSSTGFPLFNGDSVQLDINGSQTIYAISSVASNTLFALELA